MSMTDREHADPHYGPQGHCICFCARCVVSVGPGTYAKTCGGAAYDEANRWPDG